MNRANEQQLRRLLASNRHVVVRYDADRAVFVLSTEFGSELSSGRTLNDMMDAYNRQSPAYAHNPPEALQ